MASRTRTETVYERLRSDILAGRQPPGGRLGFAALQQRYAASVGVIREALVRLTEQGLVRSTPRIGFTVTPLSRTELRDLTETRVLIEGATFSLAIAHGDAHWEAQAVAAHHVLARTPVREPDDPEVVSQQWNQLHQDFHRALLAGCPNRRLRELADSLRLATELYRSWSQSLGAEPDRDIGAEHRELLAAALEHDQAGGPGRLATHIQRTTDNLLHLADPPEA